MNTEDDNLNDIHLILLVRVSQNWMTTRNISKNLIFQKMVITLINGFIPKNEKKIEILSSMLGIKKIDLKEGTSY